MIPLIQKYNPMQKVIQIQTGKRPNKNIKAVPTVGSSPFSHVFGFETIEGTTIFLFFCSFLPHFVFFIK
jgi:hypothetical protein